MNLFPTFLNNLIMIFFPFLLPNYLTHLPNDTNEKLPAKSPPIASDTPFATKFHQKNDQTNTDYEAHYLIPHVESYEHRTQHPKRFLVGTMPILTIAIALSIPVVYALTTTVYTPPSLTTTMVSQNSSTTKQAPKLKGKQAKQAAQHAKEKKLIDSVRKKEEAARQKKQKKTLAAQQARDKAKAEKASALQVQKSAKEVKKAKQAAVAAANDVDTSTADGKRSAKDLKDYFTQTTFNTPTRDPSKKTRMNGTTPAKMKTGTANRTNATPAAGLSDKADGRNGAQKDTDFTATPDSAFAGTKGTRSLNNWADSDSDDEYEFSDEEGSTKGAKQDDDKMDIDDEEIEVTKVMPGTEANNGNEDGTDEDEEEVEFVGVAKGKTASHNAKVAVPRQDSESEDESEEEEDEDDIEGLSESALETRRKVIAAQEADKRQRKRLSSHTPAKTVGNGTPAAVTPGSNKKDKTQCNVDEAQEKTTAASVSTVTTANTTLSDSNETHGVTFDSSTKAGASKQTYASAAKKFPQTSPFFMSPQEQKEAAKQTKTSKRTKALKPTKQGQRKNHAFGKLKMAMKPKHTLSKATTALASVAEEIKTKVDKTFAFAVYDSDGTGHGVQLISQPSEFPELAYGLKTFFPDFRPSDKPRTPELWLAVHIVYNQEEGQFLENIKAVLQPMGVDFYKSPLQRPFTSEHYVFRFAQLDMNLQDTQEVLSKLMYQNSVKEGRAKQLPFALKLRKIIDGKKGDSNTTHSENDWQKNRAVYVIGVRGQEKELSRQLANAIVSPAFMNYNRTGLRLALKFNQYTQGALRTKIMASILQIRLSNKNQDRVILPHLINIDDEAPTSKSSARQAIMQMKRPTNDDAFAVLAIDRREWGEGGTIITFVKGFDDVAHDLEFTYGILAKQFGIESHMWFTATGIEEAELTKFDEATGRPISADDALMANATLPGWLVELDGMELLQTDEAKRSERPARKGILKNKSDASVNSGEESNAALTFGLGNQTIASSSSSESNSTLESEPDTPMTDATKPLSSFAPTFNPPDDNISSITDQDGALSPEDLFARLTPQQQHSVTSQWMKKMKDGSGDASASADTL